MATKLVILESPNKIKTVKGYLGKNYKVIASQGHVRDLPKSTLGIDVENEFTPKNIQTKDSRANLVYAVKIAVKNDRRLKLGLAGEVIL